MPTSFTVNKADLDYILKQIRIAEATSIGYTSTPISTLQAIMNAYGATAATASQLPAGLRTVDGTDNNLLPGQSNLGAADTLFPRLTDPVYRNEADGDTMPLGPPGSGAPIITNTNYGVPGSVADADPRIISNLIVDMSINNPAAIAAYLGNPLSLEQFEADHPGMTPVRPGEAINANDLEITNTDLQTIPNQSPDIGLSPGFNAWMTFFGQFFDHGLDLVTKGANGTVYVPLQADDPLIAGADGILIDDPNTTVDETADNLPPHLQFMALTRATPTYVPGDANGDGVIAAGEVMPQHENTTTSWIDQNQTYTSHASHQVFLREYVKLDGKTVSTGRLLDGESANGSLDRAIGNWAEVKAQSVEMLGLKMNDFDVHNVPLLLTDQYGKFIPGANGYAQVAVVVTETVPGTPPVVTTTNYFITGVAGGLDIHALPDPVGFIPTPGATHTVSVIGTNHAFLNDIAHHAAPSFVDLDHNGTKETQQVADSEPGVGDDGDETTYDDEMLNAHFVTGDGRGNENIALTTVHSIFHSEHNRLVDVNKATILQSNDLAFLNEWLLVDVTAVPMAAAEIAALNWDGERLFQAARFGTEMQYQHLVFEEFARRMQPMVDPFIFNNSPNIDPSIVAEFAHTVYRFGHSMLTGTVDRLENDLTTVNGDAAQKTLLAVFLNPQAYIGSGATLEQVNANIIRGLSRDVGNALDEFIVTDVRSNLLGLPLDLAVLNIARGRDTGIPSLNQTRAQLYNDTGLADLKPYVSWIDFAENIKNAASVVNFIAAYGTHASITSETTLAGKRAAAENLVFNTTGDPADRDAFINGTGIYASDLGGLNDVDLWIGGLAEKTNEFGGMLGSTFNFVFETQMEKLQFGDRMYYLTRTQGLNFLNQLEPNTFADLVMRNTELGGNYSTHLNGALFATPDHILELDPGIAQEDYDSGAGKDPLWAPGEPHSVFASKVTRILGTDTSNANGNVAGDGHYEGGTLKFLGGEHVVLGGTEGNDTLLSDRGIDTIWGDGGDDYINAGMESDDVFGGTGDDIIEDPFGDDVLRGNQGNDVITSARGADLMFGDDGTDYMVLGQDAGEIFGGTGGDFILGGDGKDFLLGNEGDDWIEGGAGFDTIAGDNSELFFNSPIIGHDVLFGQGDETDYDAESGDDIMTSGPSVFRYEGMFGFDWGIAKMDVAAVNFDLQIPIFTTIPNDVLRDRFDQVEALSGWTWDDHLDGDDRGHKGGGSSAPDSIPVVLFTDHVLTQEGINRIEGFNTWFGGARQTLFGNATPIPGATSLPVTTYRDGNILMGGEGNDFLRGRGGYDILDGDAWLNVRIKIVIPQGRPNAGTYSAESMNTDTTVAGPYAGMVFNTDTNGNPIFTSPAFGGASLTSLLLNRTINPGQLSIVREIKNDMTPDDNVDTAIFQGTLAEYTIEGRGTIVGGVEQRAYDLNGDGFISVRDNDTGAVGATVIVDGVETVLASRGALTDDVDLLKNVERLQFADQTIAIAGNNAFPTGAVTINDPTSFNHDGDSSTPNLVTPYVGQVLTATLTGISSSEAPLGLDGLPFGLTFEWQTTELGSNAGWSTITSGLTYTVRSVDPAHVLRAVAVFKDPLGVTERIASEATDGATVPFSVNENSPTGTIVTAAIPFSVDYDPLLGATDGDIATLTHVMAPGGDAGGRFRIVSVGGVDQLQVVNNPGTADDIDFETAPTPGGGPAQYQIVINSYIDAASAAAADPAGLLASRQFTVLIRDVNPEGPAATPPSDINWNGVRPAESALPLTGVTIANLTTVDPDGSTVTYTKEAGSDADISVSSAGVVSRTGGLAQNTTYVLNVKSQETPGSAFVTESFNIRTGTDNNDTISGSALTDIIYGDDNNDTLNGLGGNDSLLGQDEVDTLNGGDGDDVLIGGDDNDTINGGAGNDTIHWSFNNGITGAGTDVDDDNDTIDGGANIDTLVITGTGGSEQLDVVFDGTAITQIEGGGSIVNVEFGAANLLGGTDTLDYDGTTANVTVDLTLGTASGFSSIAGIENVMGDAGNDTLIGLAGQANVLTGGAGNDMFTVHDLTLDTIHEANNGGTDTVLFSSAVNGQTYVLNDLDLGGGDGTADVENLTLLGSATLNGTGNVVANAITGNSGANTLSGLDGNDTLNGLDGADTLLGGAGNDTLDGGTGADTMRGGANDDTYVVDNLGDIVDESIAGSSGTDLVLASVSHTLAANVENLTLTGTAANGTGNALGNVITHVSGTANVLTGLGGNDTYNVGTGDTVVEALNQGTDLVNSTVDFTLGANVENLTLTGTATTGTGNELANAITGNASANQLFGGGGVDTINGNDGNDLIDGGIGSDNLNGGAGNDTIIGGEGNDTIDGGTGNDVIRYSANGFGNDVVNGFDAIPGGGQDLIDLSGMGVTAANFAARVTLTTVAGPAGTLVAVDGATGGTIRLNGVTLATLSQSDFTLATTSAPIGGATNGNNTLNGGGGNDTINALGGDDTVNGNGGNDTITGGTGNDAVNGGSGDDTIIWNANAAAPTDGHDIVNGGTEGAAGDTFVVNGNVTPEVYHVYTKAAWAGVAGNNISSLAVATEIVITRNGSDFGSIIGELSEIEEIRLNGVDPAGASGGAGAGDTFQLHGDFSGTSLRLNTITIDGHAGNDTIDISALTSAHRIVFRSNGGNDTIIGTLRPQDVIELPAGATAADYTTTTSASGVSTMTDGLRSITFTSAGGLPQVTEGGVGDDALIVLPNVGTPGNDVLTGDAANDYLVGFAGDDVIIGNGGKDVLLGNEGKDFLASGAGEDSVFGGAGSDIIIAGEDADLVYGDEDDDRIFTDDGNDMVNGGAGNDTVVAGAGNDLIVAELNDGNDAYFGDEINGGNGTDTLDMSAISANATVDLGTGLAGHGSAFSAQSGSDTLWGVENVITGSGADTVIASDAVNVIDGGAGNDSFVFKSVMAANGDTIVGFETGDKIDLGAIDANTAIAGNQAFTLVNGAQISGVGQLLVTHETRADGDYTVIEGNVANSTAPEFKVSIKGTHDLHVNDFSL